MLQCLGRHVFWGSCLFVAGVSENIEYMCKWRERRVSGVIDELPSKAGQEENHYNVP